jgi:putative transcriptional regulator
MNILRNHIEQFRKRKGVSRSHLARQVGVCPSHITMLEKQVRKPSVEVAFRLAGYFKCRFEELFEYRGGKTGC